MNITLRSVNSHSIVQCFTSILFYNYRQLILEKQFQLVKYYNLYRKFRTYCFRVCLRISSGVQISFRRFSSKIGYLLLNDVKLLVESLLMYVQVLLTFGTNLDPKLLLITRLRTLSTFRYVLCFRCQIRCS